MPGNRPANAGILGFGLVGLEAAKALKHYSDAFFLNKTSKTQGMIINLYPRNITENPEILKEQLKTTDILIDASRRKDPSQYIIENSWLQVMPEHAVILDLSADPYNTNISPIQVKGIEGIPTGTLDQLVYLPKSPVYDTIPQGVDTTHRRTVISCNAWPGVDPVGCMTLYSKQLIYFLKELISRDPTKLSIHSDDPYERALARSSLEYFLDNQKS
jgi:alanine dehydrogenase